MALAAFPLATHLSTGSGPGFELICLPRPVATDIHDIFQSRPEQQCVKETSRTKTMHDAVVPQPLPSANKWLCRSAVVRVCSKR